MSPSLPYLGVGLSYRWELNGMLKDPTGVDWLEITPEHFLPANPDTEGRLALLARRFPLVGHGLELSVGSDGPCEPEYLAPVRRLLDAAKAAWHGDHLCFTRSGAHPIRALTPLPFTEEAVEAVARTAREARAALGRELVLENIAYYFKNPLSALDEAEFLTRAIARADCGLLLDLHNVLANAVNHKFDPYRFLDRLPLDRVVQIHLAGGVRKEDVLFDSHSTSAPDEVWSMLEYVVPRCPVRGINFEMDSDFLPPARLKAELARARGVLERHGASAA